MRGQKKRQMKCILWGQAHYQNQMMVSVRKEGEGDDTIAPNSSKWGSLTRQTHMGKAAGAPLGLSCWRSRARVCLEKAVCATCPSLKKCLRVKVCPCPSIKAEVLGMIKEQNTSPQLSSLLLPFYHCLSCISPHPLVHKNSSRVCPWILPFAAYR